MKRTPFWKALCILALVFMAGCSAPDKPQYGKSEPGALVTGKTVQPQVVRGEKPRVEPSAPSNDEPRAARPAQEIAYDIMLKDAGESAWKQMVAKARDQYSTWEHDNPSGNTKIFLDDRLLQIAPSVPSGQIPVLKKFLMYLALYKEFGEPPPKYIRDIKEKHKQALEDLLADFSWEKASDMVRKKSAEYTPAERAKLNESMKKHE